MDTSEASGAAAGPLTGLPVLDLGTVYAAPITAMLLADNLQTLYVRSHLVLASRAAGIGPPIDSVYPHLNDPIRLEEQAEFAR